MAIPQRIPGVVVRPLEEKHLLEADRIIRLAFGTFLGLPDPRQFCGDAEFARSRWKADPEAVFGAEISGELVGSVFVTHWGSFGFFGPLTVRPDWWDQGIGQRLLEPTMALFEEWGVRHRGLYTFAHSPKHIALYQKYGFWPRHLTPVMGKPIPPTAKAPSCSKLSETPAKNRGALVNACREVTSAVYEGLEVQREIDAVVEQGLGDVVLLGDGTTLEGFAVCHCGAGTEAGSGVCYVKFGAVRPGPKAGENFDRLLEACATFGAEREDTRVIAGVNIGRLDAYRRMLRLGFRTEYQGVAMETGPPGSGYNHPDVYVVDDWR